MSSIMVRITGIACLGLSIIVVAWLLAMSTSEAAFETANGLLRSGLGKLIMFGATWAVFYHMLGRLRHVIWDFGYALDVRTSEKMGIGMFVGATILAVLAVVIL